jgi:hypothetical protein
VLGGGPGDGGGAQGHSDEDEAVMLVPEEHGDKDTCDIDEDEAGLSDEEGRRMRL